MDVKTSALYPPNVMFYSFVFLDFSFKVAISPYCRPQNSRRSRPPKAADFFGCYFVVCTDVSWASKIKTCRLASYLMEHVYFEAQLCSDITTLKEKSGKIIKYAKKCLAGGDLALWQEHRPEISDDVGDTPGTSHTGRNTSFRLCLPSIKFQQGGCTLMAQIKTSL